jgi:PPK2 family polyphosphate:nucleotide phosphotransferase
MKYSKRFRVEPGSKVKLADIDAGFKDRHEDRESAQSELEQNSRRLAELQYLMYAEDQRSLLIVLQAMDAGGKDGVVNHVISAMNPQGCAVHAFKAPSAEELAHDYLWRIHRVTPAKGQVTIFNRSHYEDVLVVRVHDLVPKKVWSKRYDEINDFEQFLTENGTHVVKFFLHIDAEEQLARFKQRLDDPGRHWKISESDYSERAYWDQYQHGARPLVRDTCQPQVVPESRGVSDTRGDAGFPGDENAARAGRYCGYACEVSCRRGPRGGRGGCRWGGCIVGRAGSRVAARQEGEEA